jgi:hypothetical protein
MKPETTSELYARCVRGRFEGEPLLDAIHRQVVADFVVAYGSQNKAAEVLGVSRGVVHRQVQAAIARKVNVRVGRTDLNRTARGRFPRAVGGAA